MPGESGHTFYVWFDALLGYLSALLDDGGAVDLDRLSEAGWPASVHVIGKDILRFHAVYWPAMLMSAGLPLPKHVFGHGFLTREGQKMGKSLGNVLDPEKLLSVCGADAVRWYLLRDMQFGDDGDFQQQRFVDLVNNDLANTIGNLLNRTSSMARKWFNDAVPPARRPWMAPSAGPAECQHSDDRGDAVPSWLSSQPPKPSCNWRSAPMVTSTTRRPGVG